MNNQIKIKVFGKVQGVFFRYFTKTKANELGIRGFVRNMPDGTVEIVTQGNSDVLDKFIDWLKQGSDLAKVEKIDVSHETSNDEFKDFSIR